jgi:hypothetical protein
MVPCTQGSAPLGRENRYQGFWGEVLLELGDAPGAGSWCEAWRLRHHFQASRPTLASAALRKLLPPKVPRRERRPMFLSPNIVRLLYRASCRHKPTF